MDMNDIRAHTDEELPDKLQGVLTDPEFHRTLAEISAHPAFQKLAIQVQGTLGDLETLAKSVSTVEEFQGGLVGPILEIELASTTDGVSYTGLKNIRNNLPTLYISNHRSTFLDPAVVNYILWQNGFDSIYNAFGSNISATTWLDTLLRLNKGFLIQRNPKSRREIVEAKKIQSAYIRQLLDAGNSVWIAQREGRAKDGNDKTNTAVIGMLYDASSSLPYQEWISSTNIMPISLSWEVYPCGELIAMQRAGLVDEGDDKRDLRNILHELLSHKGRVHVSFGQPLGGELGDKHAIAKELDRQISTNYMLWDANWLAYVRTEKDLSSEERVLILSYIDQRRAHQVLESADKLPLTAKKNFLEMYANPVRNALRYAASLQDLLDRQEMLASQAHQLELASQQK